MVVAGREESSPAAGQGQRRAEAGLRLDNRHGLCAYVQIRLTVTGLRGESTKQVMGAQAGWPGGSACLSNVLQPPHAQPSEARPTQPSQSELDKEGNRRTQNGNVSVLSNKRSMDVCSSTCWRHVSGPCRRVGRCSWYVPRMPRQRHLPEDW